MIEEEFSRYSRDELVEMLLEADFPVAPLQNIAEASSDSHLRQRETVVDIEDSDGDDVTVGVNPVKFDGIELGTADSLFEAGTHTIEILQERGIPDSKIAMLKQRGVFDE